uniref:Aldedh domain-containing protein n=1 Tax=Caenorhabditis tropicalis TaxID=1561998 RepID=A0A1I7UUF8_9PELO
MLKSALEGFEKWAFSYTAKQRGAILHKWFEILLQLETELATLLTKEQGKPLAEARGEIQYSAAYFDWYAGEARRVYGQVVPSAVHNRLHLHTREPIGVVALISPWNFPTAMIARKAAAALSVGCSAVVKPAEDTPLSALALAQTAEEAGVPAGVFNVITADRTNTAANRIFVQKKIHDQYVSELASAMKEKQVLENGMDPKTTQGPLVNKRSVNKCELLLSDALEKGSELICGGKRGEHGTSYEPTLITNVQSNTNIANTEIFGPIAPIQKFRDNDEVLQAANNCRVGLAGYIFGRDPSRLQKVARKVEVGIITGKRQFSSSDDDRWTGMPYRKFDVLISDVDEKELEDIGSDNGIPHLSPGNFSADPFPVKGRVHGINLRLMVPLVCQYNGNVKSQPHNVWFLVDPGSPYTCLTVKSVETLVGEGFARDLHSFDIQVPKSNIECYLSKGHFTEVNILGMNAMRRLRLSVEINWDTETFELVRR